MADLRGQVLLDAVHPLALRGLQAPDVALDIFDALRQPRMHGLHRASQLAQAMHDL
ncbi:hypothetical protein [Candidatus Dactylopiibacterium carminicum]|uniref:hypothetical protein n=1 Tax=Candidatus Dactylopiibacterium carminicum TaxID=857335 RepID=UPI001555022C|nr:hypothetical protein [Candidatus Dactylopiibacterium carminicum]